MHNDGVPLHLMSPANPGSSGKLTCLNGNGGAFVMLVIVMANVVACLFLF